MDIIHKLLGRDATDRRTTTWTLGLFFNIVDIEALPGDIIYTVNNGMVRNITDNRRKFLVKIRETELPAIYYQSQMNRL